MPKAAQESPKATTDGFILWEAESHLAQGKEMLGRGVALTLFYLPVFLYGVYVYDELDDLAKMFGDEKSFLVGFVFLVGAWLLLSVSLILELRYRRGYIPKLALARSIFAVFAMLLFFLLVNMFGVAAFFSVVARALTREPDPDAPVLTWALLHLLGAVLGFLAELSFFRAGLKIWSARSYFNPAEPREPQVPLA